ncbi:MAG: prepilin-type N-terminal cleavage/methylation domain-containing protein [Candidatus Omnitrophota bacterium]|jgi:prepilin-type N-terminal cleavage/methylation domain-containing protein
MRKSGFTLVEIMMVMAIVSLLVSVAIIEGVQFRKQANESNCMANLNAIASGFEIYSARHSGLYAQQEEFNLHYLIADGCLFQDLVLLNQVGNFRYVVASIGQAGYDLRALAVNPALADHNYQIVTGGSLLRSDTSVSSDTNFKSF